MANQSLNERIASCARLIEGIRSAVITAHVNPDGDAIGSELALWHLLRRMGKKVVVINSSPLPAPYDFLAGSDEILVYTPERDDPVITATDALFVLDCNSPKRLRTMESIVQYATVPKVVIDHHLEPKPFANLYVVDTDASSTAEILWRLVRTIGEHHFTKEVAEALYTGIFTDSGGFRYPRTDAELLRMAARLLEAGVDPTYMYEQIYNRGAISRTRLLGRALANIQVALDGRLCILTVTRDMMRQADATEELTEGFVEHTLALDGVRIGVLIVELDDQVKMSFRSKGQVPANAFAEMFGGGGHLNAAGARTRDYSVTVVERRIIEVAAAYFANAR